MKKAGLMVFALFAVAGLYVWSSVENPEKTATPAATEAVRAAKAEVPTDQADTKPAKTDEPKAKTPQKTTADATPPKPRAEPAAGDPRGTSNPLAGLELRDVSPGELQAMGFPEKLKGGLLIESVHPRSSAAEAQLAPGDVIVEAHKTRVLDAEALATAVEGRDHTLIKAYRKGRVFQVVLHPPWNGTR